MTEAQANKNNARRKRIDSIDIMRGLVILIMMVDHVRDMFYPQHKVSDPLNIDVIPTALFFTRSLAHLCAPSFILLAGLSAWLYAHPTSGEIRSPSRFLFTRGLFLVVLEITVIAIAWNVSPIPKNIWLQVIWATGLSMMALAVLVHIPRWPLFALGLIIVFGHNLLTPISFDTSESGYILWTILHDRGYLLSDSFVNIYVSYPVLSWIGVIVLGYSLGPIYSQLFSPDSRRKILFFLGLGCLLLMLLLRSFNIYGETLSWEYSDSIVKSVMSFINYTKYPPSLLFLLLTLGICFLILPRLENVENMLTRVLKVFGSAPMFVYILHLYLLVLAKLLTTLVLNPGSGEQIGFYSVLGIWSGGILLMISSYYPTKKFATYKRNSKKWWLRYL